MLTTGPMGPSVVMPHPCRVVVAGGPQSVGVEGGGGYLESSLCLETEGGLGGGMVGGAEGCLKEECNSIAFGKSTSQRIYPKPHTP